MKPVAEIRDSKLYREHYQTFDAYCNERWGWTRQRAYQVISAAEVSTVGKKPAPIGAGPMTATVREAQKRGGGRLLN